MYIVYQVDEFNFKSEFSREFLHAFKLEGDVMQVVT